MNYENTPAEKQSNLDRVRHAELLIETLPPDHDSRNTWLLNYGSGAKAWKLRRDRGIMWNPNTRAADIMWNPNTRAADIPNGARTLEQAIERDRNAPFTTFGVLETPFKPGDIVRLRSKSPPMTVISVGPHHVWCVWISYQGDGSLHRSEIPLIALEREKQP